MIHVAGGYQLRTKARYADTIRALNNSVHAASFLNTSLGVAEVRHTTPSCGIWK